MIPYDQLRVIDTPIPAERQSAKRHYGVHPYFTRRPFNVVRDYILHYSRVGDRVLDPFGGSGVTAIEAFLENRVGIHNDINPLANFIASGIAELAKGNPSEYRNALAILEDSCANRLSKIEESDNEEIASQLGLMSLPKNAVLPSNSDVNFLYDLFETKQLAGLAIIRDQINKLSNRHARDGMLLA